MKRLLFQMISAGLGLWLATLFVAGVKVQVYPNSNFFGAPLNAQWQFFILLGIILGLLNYFVKPILNIITLPLRIITLGFFGLIVEMALIWTVSYIFEELSIPLFYPLLWTALIIWALNLLLYTSVPKEENNL